jgi:hypothetical protein
MMTFFFFLVGLGFGFTLAKQALYCLHHAFSLFGSDYFGDGLFQTICPGWP